MKTPHVQCRAKGSIPGQVTEISHALQCEEKTNKQPSTMCYLKISNITRINTIITANMSKDVKVLKLSQTLKRSVNWYKYFGKRLAVAYKVKCRSVLCYA